MPSRSKPDADALLAETRWALLAETRWLRGVARGLVRNDAAADDLAQDVAVAALAGRPAMGEGGLRGWLRTVARRRAGRLRSRRRTAQDAEWYAARPEVAPADESLTSHDRLVLHGELARAIDALPESDRDVVVWRYFDDRDSAWIARELGVSPAAARQRLSRALARLRGDLDGSERGRDGWAFALAALAASPSGSLLPGPESPPRGDVLPTTVLPTAIAAMTATKLAAAAALVLAAVWVATSLDREPAPDPDLTVEGDLASAAPDLAPPAAEVAAAESRRAVGGDVPSAAVPPEPTPAAAPPRLLVVDGDGAPVPTAGAAWVDDDVQVHALEVDDLGSAELPPEQPLTLFVAAAGHMFERREVESLEPGQVVEVQLGPVRTISGRVFVDGAPPPPSLSFLGFVETETIGLRRATASAAQPLRDVGAFPESPRIQPDRDGAFRCRVSHPAESISVYISPAFELRSVTAGGEPLAPRSERVDLPVGADDIMIDLVTRPAITGRFVWEGTDAAVTGDFLYSVNDEEGYSIGGSVSEELMRDGTFWVGVERGDGMDDDDEERKRGAKVMLTVFHREARSGFQRIVELVGLEFPHDLGSIEIPRLERRGVLVLGRTDTGLVPIVASLASSDGRASTDAEGRAELFARTEGHVDVFAPGFAFVRLPLADLTPDSDGTLRIVLERAPVLRVRAVSLEPAANPRAAPRIRIRHEGASPYGFGPTEGERPEYHFAHHRCFYPRGRGAHILTQPGSRYADYYVPNEGDLEVHGLRPGSSFQVDLLDGVDQVLATTAVAMGESDRTIELEPSATSFVTCVVEEEGAGPVDSATVKIKGSEWRSLRLEVEDGRVTIGPLAPGSYDLMATTKDGRSAELQGVTIGPGASEVTLVVQ